MNRDDKTDVTRLKDCEVLDTCVDRETVLVEGKEKRETVGWRREEGQNPDSGETLTGGGRSRKVDPRTEGQGATPQWTNRTKTTCGSPVSNGES